MTLDDTPPGQEPIRIRPAATSCSNPKSRAKTKPPSGMMLYCSTATITIARGAESTRVKSASVSVIPMHSRMNCTSGEMTCFISNPPGAMNTCGNVRAAEPNASTTKVNPSPSSQRTRQAATASAANSAINGIPTEVAMSCRPYRLMTINPTASAPLTALV